MCYNATYMLRSHVNPHMPIRVHSLHIHACVPIHTCTSCVQLRMQLRIHCTCMFTLYYEQRPRWYISGQQVALTPFYLPHRVPLGTILFPLLEATKGDGPLHWKDTQEGRKHGEGCANRHETRSPHQVSCCSVRRTVRSTGAQFVAQGNANNQISVWTNQDDLNHKQAFTCRFVAEAILS